MGIAGSARHAERQREAGVDAVIAQGYEAGGHTGTVASFVLIPEVVDRVAPLPVIGAGGIADGRGVAAALALGAQAAWCGTAFLYATETDITDTYRTQLTEARSHDLVVSRSYTGKPSRIVRNPVLDAWSESGLQPLPMPYQHVLMDDLVEAAERGGHPELINHPAGQAAGLIREHEPAAAIVRRMAEEAATTIDRLAGRASAAA
jgi:NAD(P)H-dependent flavin oxidoreductase YrpB (nitropropane dioxygenase family)